MGERLYWHGNAAKAEIVGQILDRADERSEFSVLDYGCGDGGDWPAILGDHPKIRLILVEPDQKAASIAASRLQTHVHTSPPPCLQVDAAVSLSVLEHVRDRRAYLATVKQALAEDGTFWLCYDDGHFRGGLTFDRPDTWLYELQIAALNVLRPRSRYQARVHRTQVDRLVGDIGFEVVSVRYGNLACMKALAPTVENRDDFMRLWVDLETEMNTRHAVDMDRAHRGDTTNLWTVMPTRTLELRHART